MVLKRTCQEILERLSDLNEIFNQLGYMKAKYIIF